MSVEVVVEVVVVDVAQVGHAQSGGSDEVAGGGGGPLDVVVVVVLGDAGAGEVVDAGGVGRVVVSQTLDTSVVTVTRVSETVPQLLMVTRQTQHGVSQSWSSRYVSSVLTIQFSIRM